MYPTFNDLLAYCLLLTHCNLLSVYFMPLFLQHHLNWLQAGLQGKQTIAISHPPIK